MKSVLRYLTLAVGIYGFAALVACNKSGMDSTTASNGGCGNGYTYNGATCVPITVSTTSLAGSTRVGYVAQTANFSTYTGLLASGSSMNLGNGYQYILRNAMGICDRSAVSGGQASCSYYQQGIQDIVIMFDSPSANSAKLVIRSFPVSNPYFNYSYTFPSASEFFLGLMGIYVGGNPTGVFDPLILTATVYPINNNQGFELRANGPTYSSAWWRLLQFQVMNGKLEDGSISYKLYIDDGNQNMALAASGTMVRCQTVNCAISGL